jgi:predicted enzyme related to lactoylglutathione lyase
VWRISAATGSPAAFDLPMGRIAIAQDPQGAAFALYAGDLAP